MRLRPTRENYREEFAAPVREASSTSEYASRSVGGSSTALQAPTMAVCRRCLNAEPPMVMTVCDYGEGRVSIRWR